MRKAQLVSIIVLLLCVDVVAQVVPSDFDVHGHRGARGLQAENTLPSFETALDLGVTTLELDLHFTSDSQVIVWHDEAISYDKCRLPEGVTEESIGIDQSNFVIGSRPLQISQLSLEQVQTFICDLNPDPNQFPDQINSGTAIAGENYHIQTLEAVFEFVSEYAVSELKSLEQRDNASHVDFNIETKRQANRPLAIGDDFEGERVGAFELAILAIIDDNDMLDRVIIQSFDHRSIWAIKAAEPDITIAALTNRGRPRLAYYAEQGATIWSPRYTELTQALVDEAHELNLRVIPWTVNDINDMRQLIAMGVDGIITDYPNTLLHLLQIEYE